MHFEFAFFAHDSQPRLGYFVGSWSGPQLQHPSEWKGPKIKVAILNEYSSERGVMRKPGLSLPIKVL